MELERMDVTELASDEAMETSGGGFWENLAMYLIGSATKHYDVLKQGVIDGFSGEYNPPK